MDTPGVDFHPQLKVISVNAILLLSSGKAKHLVEWQRGFIALIPFLPAHIRCVWVYVSKPNDAVANAMKLHDEGIHTPKSTEAITHTIQLDNQGNLLHCYQLLDPLSTVTIQG
jgi:hypothetical protein